MYITLYRKYRPQNFEEMAGQKEIIKTIKTSLRNKRVAHAYLFNGPRGVGKTTTARLIAKGVNCLNSDITDEPCNECENCLAINNGIFMDMVEIDAASNRGIDEIRALKEKINYQPVKGRKKIYIIDEVHMLTKEAFNALLKTLEEPPEHIIFILATTEADKILPTIISRCQRYDFKTLSSLELKEQLRTICEKENATITDEALEIIYENSSGSVRDAISILERVIIACYGEEITLEKCEKILDVTPSKVMQEFLELALKGIYNEMVKKLENFWNNSIDIENFFKDFAKYCKNKISDKELDIEKGLSFINIIYSTIAKFRYEEDKRLIGYVVVDEMVKSTIKQVEIEKIVERVVVEQPKITQYSEEKDSGMPPSFDVIRQNWEEILKEAKKEKITLGAFLIGASPYKIEGNTLYVIFESDYEFCKEQMENRMYGDVFTNVVRKFSNSTVNIKYVIESRKRVEKKESNITQDILEYFGGEIINGSNL